MERESYERWLKYLLIAGFALIVVCGLYVWFLLSPRLAFVWNALKAVLFPLFVSIVIAYLLNPIVRFLNQRGVPRGVAVLAIYFSFIALSALLLTKLIPAFIVQMKEFGERLPDIVRVYQRWLNEIHEHKYDLPDSLRASVDQALFRLEQKSTAFFANVLDGAGALLTNIVSLIVIPFLVFYLLKDMRAIQKGILLFIPRKYRKEFGKAIAEIDEALGNYIAGQLLVAFAAGTLAYLAYLALGMPYALILALAIMITNVIPYFGPIIGAIPSVFVALTISTKMTVWVIVVIFLVQIIEGNILSPFIMGKRLRLHPILIILALLVGGEAGGLIGLIFAVPIVAVARVVVNRALIQFVKH